MDGMRSAGTTAPVTRPHVFRRLLAEVDLGLRPRVLSKGTLTELSHVLENAVIEHDLPGAVFTGFQTSANWLRALDRYQRLVTPRARSVAVFATGNVTSMGDEAIVKVQLGEDSPLTEEWFLVVLTTGFSAVLLGEETGEPYGTELERSFDTIWSFDPVVVTKVTQFIHAEVATFDPTTAARVAAALEEFPPGPEADHLRDVVIGDIIEALERSRQRLAAVAEIEQRAADELRELDRAKNAFLSAVSHELRTPLTVVHGMAATLSRMSDALSPEQRSRLETSLLAQTDRLALLLDDLLDVDRISRGRLTLRVERSDVVATSREIVAASVHRDRVVVIAPERLETSADQTQVQRIVANLIENAGKYAPTGSIVLELSTLDDGGLRISVTDQGPGIPTSEQLRIFEAFHRVDDDHPQPGTGIGLALVAEFARLHGGRAWAEDRSSLGGARLVVELPDVAQSADGGEGVPPPL